MPKNFNLHFILLNVVLIAISLSNKGNSMFIGEASKLSGATQRAIRLYESVGLLKVSREGKYRVYTSENIALIKIVKEAQTLDISLSEMVALISKQEVFDWNLVRDFLSKKHSMIENEINNLEMKKKKIVDLQVSIDACLQQLDSNP